MEFKQCPSCKKYLQVSKETFVECPHCSTQIVKTDSGEYIEMVE